MTRLLRHSTLAAAPLLECCALREHVAQPQNGGSGRTAVYGLGKTTLSTPSAGGRRGHVTRAPHPCPCLDGRAERQGVRPGAGYACPCPWAPHTVCVGGLSHNVACGLGGAVRATEGCRTQRRVSSLQPCQTALPAAPQNLPEVLPYPILRRLSSTRRRRTAPRSAGLPDLVASRFTPHGKEEGHATMRVSRCPRMSRRRCAPLDPLGWCAEQRRAAPPGARPLSPRADRDRGKVGLPSQRCGSDCAPLAWSHLDQRPPTVGD
jgi:hypothetical protein